MVTKGIIKTLDLTGNTCTVRLPLFETAGNDHIIGTATISNTPGSYNGYKEGDVVWVAFEDGSMNSPVVIGKLYLGVEEERKDPRGVLNVENSTVSKTASMPADTKLSVQTDHNIPNTTSPFGSLSSIANNLNALNTSVAQNDRDYGNKFKQVASEIDTQGTQFRSSLTQTAKEIRAEVAAIETDLDGKITDTNSTLTQTAGEIRAEVNQVEIELDGKITATNSKLDLTADNINAEVSTKVSSNSDTAEQAFGWNLKSDEWTVYNKTNEIVTNATDLWVDIVQKVVKVEETAEDGTTTEKDIVKQYYAINNIITTREVGTETSLPTIKSTGDNTAPWAWADIESGPEKTIQVIGTNNETKPLTNVKNVKKVLIADKDGLEVRGTIKAEDGLIGSFTIGNKGENGHSGIYSNNYITKFSDNPGTKNGVYVGTDGIKLGPNFSVDTTGEVTATGLKINLTDEQKNMLSGTTTITYAYHSDGKTPPSTGWSKEIPELSSEEDINKTPYFWTKTETTFAWSDTPKAPKISYTVSKIGSSVKTEVLYKLSTSSSNSEAYTSDTWSTNVKVPTKAIPYVWTKTRVITNGESVDSTPTLHDSFDNLISILSVDGIDIISSTGTGNDKEYHLKADTLSGAVSDQVTIGGFTIGNTRLQAGEDSSLVAIQSGNSLPGYSLAEYIESTGEQYIDTGYIINYNTDVVEITVAATVAEQTGMIFGHWESQDSCHCALYHYHDDDGNNTTVNLYGCHSNLGQQPVASGVLLTDFTRHTYKIAQKKLFVDNCYVGELPAGTITPSTSYNSYIAAAPDGATSADGLKNANWFYSGKIYGCKIWKKEGTALKLKADFVPARKGSTYGLYDYVTKNFYTSPNKKAFKGKTLSSQTFDTISIGGNNPNTIPFKVTNTGALQATSGNIGGLYLENGYMTSSSLDNFTKWDDVYWLYDGGSNNVDAGGTFTSSENLGTEYTFGYNCWKFDNCKTPNSTGGGYIKIQKPIAKLTLYFKCDSDQQSDVVVVGEVNKSAADLKAQYEDNGAVEPNEVIKATSFNNYNSFIKVTFFNLVPDDRIWCIYFNTTGEWNAAVWWPTIETMKADNCKSVGGVGENKSIWIAPKGVGGTISGESKTDWGLTLGNNFGVDLSGNLYSKGGTFSGTLTSSGCYLDNVQSFNFTGDSFTIGGMELQNYLTKTSTTKQSVTFRISAGSASYIGSSTIYKVTITANKIVAENVTLTSKLKNASYRGNYSDYPISKTIDFNQEVVFPKGKQTLEVSIIAGSFGQYGDWDFISGRFDNNSTSVTQEALVATDENISLLQCSGGFVPKTNGTGTLGLPDRTWGNIYGKNIYANGDVQFKLNNNSYSPVVRLTETNSPNCFWSATKRVSANDWASIDLPADIHGKVVSAAVSAHYANNNQTNIRPGTNKDMSIYDCLAAVSNCWYVDFISDDTKLWVYNGQQTAGTLNVLVAAKI